LTEYEVELLKELNKYHLTLLEQFYLDNIDPSLNLQPLANASSWNLGATGHQRDDDFRTNLSNLHMGRQFTDSTKELWRSQMTGYKLSQETRNRMSVSAGGVLVYVQDVNNGKVTVFKTKTEACEFLGTSMRTLSR
jgi:hypothetical protein